MFNAMLLIMIGLYAALSIFVASVILSEFRYNRYIGRFRFFKLTLAWFIFLIMWPKTLFNKSS